MPSRLKSLELHGYKTFATKSLFEFPGMVTAIVGPNGSGKSNIADALRWVLGEQSYSLLRGKKTEDMIFAGSEQRPRAGMASACITFDNSDNWLPIDFSEVSITRRAYRDGQNEYLLNGQRVRLREISELLSQSGLAERTYTIIGQGLVDAALALKPEERRRLFEEAAGIGLYRSRKEEALNRLDTTHRNLDRVKDILAELEPRLQSLEKQARRAQEYERVKADLKLLLRDWYGYHWHKSQVETKRAREIVRNQSQRMEEARKHHQNINDRVNRSKVKIQNYRSLLNDWYNESSELSHELEKTGRNLAVLEERQKALVKQQGIFHDDLQQVETADQENESVLTHLQAERTRLQVELEEAQQQIYNIGQKLQEQRKERKKFDDQLREERRSLLSNETRSVQLKVRQDELQHQLEVRQNDMQSISRSHSNLLNDHAKQIEEYHRLIVQKEEVEKLLDAAIADQQEIQNNLADLEKERKIISDSQSRYETEKAKNQTQLEVIAQAEKSLSGYGEGARYLDKAFSSGKLHGSHHALANLLQVAPEFEAAVTAALGEFLDLIILGPEIDTEPVFQFLDTYAQDKAIILPVDWIRNLDTQNGIINDPDYIGHAPDYVTCEESYKNVIEALLGNVLIVRDRKAARRLVTKITEPVTLVTLKGEVYSPKGPVTIGLVSRSGLISRQREKNELLETLQQIDNQLDLLARSSIQLDERLLTLQQAEKTSTKNRSQIEEQVEKLSGQLDRLSLSLAQINQQIEWDDHRKTTIEESIKKTKIESTESTKELVVCEENIKKYAERINITQSKLMAYTDDLQSEVNHWETQKAVVTRALADIMQRENDRKSLIEKNQARKNILKVKIDENKEALTTIQQNQEEGKDQETRLTTQIRDLQGKILPAQAELAGEEKVYEDLQSDESSAQQSLSLAEKYYSQVQSEMSRQRESMESLRRRIEDDFGLVAFEYETYVTGPTPLPFEGMVEQLPAIKELPAGLEDSIIRQKNQIRRIGAVNPDALKEYQEVQDRFQFINIQVSDLHKAEADLRQVISELDELMKRDFRNTFNAVAEEFRLTFRRLFDGGSARLILDDEENLNETGIDIEARLPGRREQGLSLLSGGERSLTAAALVFALLKVSPTPFCVMDEVDAMLDESNVARFCSLLEEQSKTTQFVIITHNRNTVKIADVVYGITLGKDSVSQAISLKLDEVPDELVS